MRKFGTFMKKHSIQKISASLAALLLSGCMTVATQSESKTPDALANAKSADADYRHAK
jgi:hypothetical protein